MSSRNTPLDGQQFLELEEASELYVDEVIDKRGTMCYLDKSGSVSALIEIENDCEYDPDHIELNRLYPQG